MALVDETTTLYTQLDECVDEMCVKWARAFIRVPFVSRRGFLKPRRKGGCLFNCSHWWDGGVGRRR